MRGIKNNCFFFKKTQTSLFIIISNDKSKKVKMVSSTMNSIPKTLSCSSCGVWIKRYRSQTPQLLHHTQQQQSSGTVSWQLRPQGLPQNQWNRTLHSLFDLGLFIIVSSQPSLLLALRKWQLPFCGLTATQAPCECLACATSTVFKRTLWIRRIFEQITQPLCCSVSSSVKWPQ